MHRREKGNLSMAEVGRGGASYYSRTSRALRLEYPAMFGLTADCDVWGASEGITRQEAKAQVKKCSKGS